MLAIGFSLLAGACVMIWKRASSEVALPAPGRVLSAAGAGQEDFSALKHVLSRLQFETGTERLGEQAVGQLKEISRRYDFFRSVLSEKMDPTELTFDRYDSAARSVRSAVLENLQSVARILEQQKLGTGTDGSPNLLAEAESLLALNGKALQRLDAVTTSIREIRTSKAAAGEDLATLIGELEELAGRAGKYST